MLLAVSVLDLTQTGFNVMFDHQFAKSYYHQLDIFAEVIRHLCLHVQQKWMHV